MDTGTAIAIELSVSGVDKAIADLRKVADELKKVNSAAANSGQQSGGGGGGGYFNFQQQQNNIHIFNQKINQASKSTSSAVVGIQQMARAAGISGGLIAALDNPVTAVIAGVTAAAGSLAVFTKQAVDAGIVLRDLAFTGGGNRSETAQLSTIGNALGLDMGALAREFADQISHNGLAAGFAARSGIHDYGIFDTTDKAQKLLKWINALGNMGDVERRRAARATGTEALLPLATLSDQTKQNLAEDAQRKEHIFTPEFLREATEASIAFARLQDAFTNLVVTAIKPMLPEIVTYFNEFAAGLQEFARVAEEHEDVFKGLAEMLHGFLTLDDKKVHEGIQDIADGIIGKKVTKGGIDAHANAMNRHTDALNDNTYAMRNGVFGGGERARGAVPSKWLGMNSDRYIGEARRLGAFNL